MAQFVNQMTLDRGIKPPKNDRVLLGVKHCPSLYLEVSPSGHMAWKAMYRVAGKQSKETLDPRHTRPLASVAEAVAWARGLHDRARGGGNPRAERRAAAERAALNTVATAVERWLAMCERDLKPKTVAGYRQIFAHDVLPWGDRPVSSITKGDVLELLNDKAAKRDRRRQGATDGAAVQAYVHRHEEAIELERARAGLLDQPCVIRPAGACAAVQACDDRNFEGAARAAD